MFVAYRNSGVTPDTAEALRKLELAGAALNIEGLKILYGGVSERSLSWEEVKEIPGPTGLPAHLSMRPSGREVYLQLRIEGEKDPLRELALLWGIAIPLGFHPWSRYPVPGVGDQVFHFLGPLSPLLDYFHSEGRGEWAWPSLCSAAQSLEGTWGGDKPYERKIQAHLHRLGIHRGPVDGEIRDGDLASLRALGLGSYPLKEVLPFLEKMSSPKKGKKEKVSGYFSISGLPVEGFSSGGVKLLRTGAGFVVVAEGSGRVIFEIGDEHES